MPSSGITNFDGAAARANPFPAWRILRAQLLTSRGAAGQRGIMKPSSAALRSSSHSAPHARSPTANMRPNGQTATAYPRCFTCTNRNMLKLHSGFPTSIIVLFAAPILWAMSMKMVLSPARSTTCTAMFGKPRPKCKAHRRSSGRRTKASPDANN